MHDLKLGPQGGCPSKRNGLAALGSGSPPRVCLKFTLKIVLML